MFLGKKILFLKKNFVSLKKITFEILWSEVWKVGFQFMLILGFLGMYFDAAVVFVTNSSLFFRLAVAILCPHRYWWYFSTRQGFYTNNLIIVTWIIKGWILIKTLFRSKPSFDQSTSFDQPQWLHQKLICFTLFKW